MLMVVLEEVEVDDEALLFSTEFSGLVVCPGRGQPVVSASWFRVKTPVARCPFGKIHVG